MSHGMMINLYPNNEEKGDQNLEQIKKERAKFLNLLSRYLPSKQFIVENINNNHTYN